MAAPTKDWNVTSLKEKYNDTNYKYNSDRSRINPKEKLTQRYAQQVCESIFSMYIWDRCGVSFTGIRNYEEIRNYSNGNQSTWKYRQFTDGGTDPKSPVNTVVNDPDLNVVRLKNERTGDGNLNKEIMSPAPQLKLAIKGALSDIDYNLIADTIDPDSVDQKNWEMSKQLAIGRHLREINMFKQQAGLPVEDDSKYPKDTDELNLMDEMGEFKSPIAMALQEFVKHTYDISDWEPTIKEKLIDDYINFSSFCLKEYYDFEECKYKVDYVDINRLICQYSNRRDYSDSTFFGEIKVVKIANIRPRLEAAGYTEEDIKTVAMSWCGMSDILSFYGGAANPSYNDWNNYNKSDVNGTWLYDFWNVLVMDTTWIENDNEYQILKPNAITGEPSIYRGKFGKVQENTIVTTVKRRYEATWVVNTSYVYNNGISKSQPRTPDNRRPLFPYHFYIGEEKSITLRLIPAYDMFEITWLKLNNKLQELHNEIVLFDMTVLDRYVKANDANGLLKMLEQMKKTGLLPYRSLPPRGNYTGGNVKPIEKIPSTMMTVIEESLTLFDNVFKIIQSVTGINPAFLGSQPSASEGVGNVEAAIASTQKILRPCIQGLMAVKEDSAEFLAEGIRLAVRNDQKCYDAYEMVSTDVEKLKQSAFTSTQLGIKLRPKPTNQEMQMLQTEIQQLSQPGKNGQPLLRADILLRVREILAHGGDIMKVRIYVSAAVEKELKRQEMVQQQTIQMQNDGNLRLKQEEVQGDMAKEKQKGDQRLKEIEANSIAALKLQWMKQAHDKSMLDANLDMEEKKMNQNNVPQPQSTM